VSDESRTEQATPRRRHKARERGEVARSRELSAALCLVAITAFLWWQPQTWRGDWRTLFDRTLAAAVQSDLASSMPLLSWTGWTLLQWATPVLLLAWIVSVAGSLAQGGLILAPAALTPKPDRLNPAANLQRIFSLGALQGLLKSLIPTAFLGYLVVGVLARDWNEFFQMSRVSPGASLSFLFSRAFEISWKGGLVFLLWSGFDVLLARFNYERNLRMTRQEVREDFKETEGHPTIKARIRRVQRLMYRRRMMRNVARATVVVTNPNEYAVALEYRPEAMEAPVVVAKGRNFLAQQIKKEARWHGIPLVENPPLAQALYRAAEIGQAIPAKLYAAVAEILAFIYRTQGLAGAARAQAPDQPRRV
jgi:flagellar biosynthetic protein FlhB